MDDPFELLEEKVRKAAETVRRLRDENQALARERDDLQRRMATRLPLDKAPAGPSPADAARIESLNAELKHLQHEREQIRRRIASLLEVLVALDSL
jgi:FtsZ-binding cell division protein ZapB